MEREENIKSYTATELKARRGESRTDLRRVDAITDEALERLVAEDEDERGMHADWTQAKLSCRRPSSPFTCALIRRSSPFSNQRAKGTSRGCKRFSRLCGRP